MNERKTDRRTVYTKMIIKDAFLELKKKSSYYDITITDLCREAQINRGTFYRHYGNLSQVLDEILEEALSQICSVLDRIESSCCGEDCAYPLCQFLREHRKYQAVFFDDSLYSLIVDKIAKYAQQSFVEKMLQRSQCSREACDALFYFQISGCLAVSKRYANASDSHWNDVQSTIDALLDEGIQKL